jgi:hypothetical protein
MIWDRDPSKGIYTAGFCTIRRMVREYEVWWTHPQNYRLLGRAPTLKQAMGEAEDYAKDMGDYILDKSEPVLKNIADDFVDNFESAADPAHAPLFSETGASDAGSGTVRGNADPRGSRETGARGHEADACHAAEPACAREAQSEKETGSSLEALDTLLPSLSPHASVQLCVPHVPRRYSAEFLAQVQADRERVQADRERVQADRERVQAQSFLRFHLSLALWNASGILIRWARALGR